MNTSRPLALPDGREWTKESELMETMLRQGLFLQLFETETEERLPDITCLEICIAI